MYAHALIKHTDVRSLHLSAARLPCRSRHDLDGESLPLLLQAALPELDRQLLCLAVSAVLNSLLLRLAVLNRLLLHATWRYYPFGMFNAGWPRDASQVAAAQTCSASEKRLPCCHPRSPDRRTCNLCKASVKLHSKKKTKSEDR